MTTLVFVHWKKNPVRKRNFRFRLNASASQAHDYFCALLVRVMIQDLGDWYSCRPKWFIWIIWLIWLIRASMEAPNVSELGRIQFSCSLWAPKNVFLAFCQFCPSVATSVFFRMKPSFLMPTAPLAYNSDELLSHKGGSIEGVKYFLFHTVLKLKKRANVYFFLVLETESLKLSLKETFIST